MGGHWDFQFERLSAVTWMPMRASFSRFGFRGQ
jgi:hypothetical protein